MSGGPVRPWRWTRWLLRIGLPGGTSGASVRADIEEEFHEMARRTSPTRARLWHARTTLELTAHFALDGARAAWTTTKEGGSMNGWRDDLRIAVRQFRRAPAFTVTAVLTIALGIGATVAIFSVVDTVLLRPLPYENADELVAIWERNEPRDRGHNVANPGNYRTWREESTTVARMTALSMPQPVTVDGLERPDEAMMQLAEPAFFDVLGMEARLGRTFSASGSPDAEYEIVLSDRYWRERFGADPSAVGRGLQVNGRSGVVVGVLPAAYVVFGESTDVWVSMSFEASDQTNSGRWLMVLGRLAPGAGVEAAGAELEGIAAGLEDAFPEFNAGWSVEVFGLSEEILGDVRAMLWMLLGAVGLLLLIACANVANLFVVRTTARRQELAVRASLGAPRGTLVRQLLTESLVLAGSGALLGTGLAVAATGWMARVMPVAFSLPRVEGVAVNGRVLLFAAGVTVLTAIVFGLLPSLQAARLSPARTLGSEARGPSRRTGLARNALVVGEVGLSMILLAGAALFARSFAALSAVDDGIEPEAVVVGRVNLTSEAYRGDAAKVAFFEELLDRLNAAPEVEAAGGVTFLPMDGLGAGTSYWVTDRPAPAPEDRRAADIRNVSGAYFEAMGIDLYQGRLFDAGDRADAPQRVVVNRALADRYWPDGSAVGRSVVVNWVDEEPWEIVGVVENVLSAGPSVAAREAIYIPYARGTFFSWQHLAVRGSTAGAPLTELLRREVAAIDPSLPLGRVRVMSEVVDRSVARPRMTAALMTTFAALATLLAAIGLYGVLAYTVSRRVREIGVRIALGARPGRVVRMVVRQGAGLALAGLVLGGLAAVAASRLVASLLFEIQPADPLSLSAAAVVLAVIALGATVVPAWRASRVPPSEALRPD